MIERRKSTHAKMQGLELEGDLDVSDELINLFAHMANAQTILYVAMEKSDQEGTWQ